MSIEQLHAPDRHVVLDCSSVEDAISSLSNLLTMTQGGLT